MSWNQSLGVCHCGPLSIHTVVFPLNQWLAFSPRVIGGSREITATTSSFSCRMSNAGLARRENKNEGQLNILCILIMDKMWAKYKIGSSNQADTVGYVVCWRGSKNVYLTDAVDAHISASVALVARRAVGDGVAQLFWEVFVQGAAVQLTGAGWKGFSGGQRRVTVTWTNTSLRKFGVCPQAGLFTSVEDGFPLVELAPVGQDVEVTTLHVSEGGHFLRTRRDVADFVSAALSQTILPSVPWTAGY